ncbi:dUTP diphosphatase [Lysinibacillus sp. NPDC047702]|uniref:dUTP diphosphatase n=1 Tax=unclassified Lysinibacillus TaxID=2636778 RepID=UPI003D081E15
MNLTKLFETQAELDKHIMQEHPELRGQNNLDWKLLALQVELGECANEWRGFKKWSKNQESRTAVVCLCVTCQGTGDENYETVTEDAESGCKHEFMKCEECNGTGEIGYRNPLLEEYVDCLHFILTIGLEIGCTPATCDEVLTVPNLDITNQFIYLMEEPFKIKQNLRFKDIHKNKSALALNTAFSNYHRMLGIFKGLGEMLGFTWDEVEVAYFKKNRINHTRQANGY